MDIDNSVLMINKYFKNDQYLTYYNSRKEINISNLIPLLRYLEFKNERYN